MIYTQKKALEDIDALLDEENEYAAIAKKMLQSADKPQNDKYKLMMMKISIGLKATEIVKSDSFHFDISNCGEFLR